MNVLIVDDEPVARRGLRRQLDAITGVTCVGECGGRDEAVAAIVERRPDVVLLDVQLGRTTGFEIIEAIGVDAMPVVVFVTAYDRHALRAFEVHALDYVLKPVDPVRLREALDRAAMLLSMQRETSLADRLEQLLSRHAAPSSDAAQAVASLAAERLVVRDADRLSFVEVANVDWFESAGNFVRVHSADRVFLMRSTMDRIAARVAGGPDAFVRVRRSALVSVRAIATLERYGQGTYVVHLCSGAKIISSRYYQAGIRGLLRADG